MIDNSKLLCNNYVTSIIDVEGTSCPFCDSSVKLMFEKYSSRTTKHKDDSLNFDYTVDQVFFLCNNCAFEFVTGELHDINHCRLWGGRE